MAKAEVNTFQEKKIVERVVQEEVIEETKVVNIQMTPQEAAIVAILLGKVTCGNFKENYSREISFQLFESISTAIGWSYYSEVQDLLFPEDTDLPIIKFEDVDLSEVNL